MEIFFKAIHTNIVLSIYPLLTLISKKTPVLIIPHYVVDIKHFVISSIHL